jgi:hypothetical protein
VKVLIRAYNNECEATVIGEIRPVGKNMSNPSAVHKAFLLVVEELKDRYGPQGHGLLAGFLTAVDNFKEDDDDDDDDNDKDHLQNPSHHSNNSHKNTSLRYPHSEEKKDSDTAAGGDSIKFEDMLKANQNLGIADSSDANYFQDKRPSTPSPMDLDAHRYRRKTSLKKMIVEDTFENDPSQDPVMIEVKPLPKIRLSLMPSPREEDEENLMDEDEAMQKLKQHGISSSPSSSGRGKSKRSRKKSWSKKRSRKGAI